MDFNACAQCGAEIESKGIHFRKKVFCSDECCEEYEALMMDKDEPRFDDLEDDELDPDDLGYRNGDDDDDLLDDDDDDDYKIDPDDF